MNPDKTDNPDRLDLSDQPDQTKEEKQPDFFVEKPVLHGLHPFDKFICPFCGSSYFICDGNWNLCCAKCRKPLRLDEIKEETLLRPYLAKMAEFLPDSVSLLNSRRIRRFKNRSFLLRIKIEELMKQQKELGDLYIYLQICLADYKGALFEEKETKAKTILKNLSETLESGLKEFDDFESFAFGVRYAIHLAREFVGIQKDKEALFFLKQAQYFADQALKLAAEKFELMEEAKDLKALVFFYLGALAYDEPTPEKSRESFDLMYELLFEKDSFQRRTILEKNLILSIPETALFYDKQSQSDKRKRLMALFSQSIETFWREQQSAEALSFYTNGAALRIFVLFSVKEKARALKEIKALKEFWSSPEVLSLLKADPVYIGRIYTRNMIDLLQAAAEHSEGKRGLNLVQAGLDYLQKNNRKIGHEALAFEQAALHQLMADYYYEQKEWSKAVGEYQKMLDALFDLIRKWPESWLITTSGQDLVQRSSEKIELIDALIPEELGRKDLDILLADAEAYFLQARMRQPAFKKDRSFRKKARKISREYERLGLDKKAQDYLKLSKKS